jgi:hypothetical protein
MLSIAMRPMSKDTAQRLSELVSCLNANLFADTFERVMLYELSSLFQSSCVAFAYKKKNNSEEQIQLCELREGHYHNEAISAVGFSRRFSFTFHDALVSPPKVIKNFSERINRTVTSYALTHYDCIIVTDACENSYLSDDMLTLINSVMELLLHARYSVRDAVKIIGLDNERFAGARHKMKGVISSITTAVQMLSSPELSYGDSDELKKLARRGVKELTDIIDGIKETARPKQIS